MKGNKWTDGNLPLVMVGFIILALIVVIRSFRLPDTQRPTEVGCVMVGSKSDRGWNESHYNGLSKACSLHGCALYVQENVPEDKDSVFDAVDTLVQSGCNMIYMTSFGYGRYMEEIAQKYPRVSFFSFWGGGGRKNCTFYFARLYQVRYLCGIIAGVESKRGILGYVTAAPNPQTLRGINAYALGMRMANPEAKLLVRFTGSWNDEQKERESVRLLAAAGADVITYHSDKPHAIREAEALHLMSIGYNEVYDHFSENFLTAAMYDWEAVYDKVMGDHLKGRGIVSRGYWLGMAEDGVKLHEPSLLVSDRALFLVTMEKQRILTDFNVFSGVIRDNEGNLRCDAGERIGDRQLYEEMDWFVEGVEVYE